MVDHLSPAGRSRNMAAIKGKDTKPELALRRALRALGEPGYRIHRRDLPGRPDVAYIGHRVAVFVDGAFWHGHPEHWHPEGSSPYWREKISRTQERDRLADQALLAAGWTVLRFWDFDVLRDPAACAALVVAHLTKPPRVPMVSPWPDQGLMRTRP